MEYVIRIVASAAGDKQYSGMYLKSFDAHVPEAHGCGEMKLTRYKGAALKFQTILAATEFWEQQSPVIPLREDGKANRPLTAYTIAVEGFGETVQ